MDKLMTITATVTLDALPDSGVESFRSMLLSTEDVSLRTKSPEEGEALAVEAVGVLFLTVILGIRAARELADLVFHLYRMTKPAQLLQMHGGELTWAVIDDPAIARGTVVILTEGDERIELVNPSGPNDILEGTMKLLGETISNGE